MSTRTSVELALKLEAALADPEQVLIGVSFDFKKCFDIIPHNILWEVLEKQGLHARILGPLKTMYANLKRRWKIGRQGVGEEWQAYNGILQGCGLSVVLLNCLTAVWIRALEEEADPKDEVQGGGYADDINGTAASQKGGQHVVDV